MQQWLLCLQSLLAMTASRHVTAPRVCACRVSVCTSQVVLLAKEKGEVESRLELLLNEIATFEAAVRSLERDMAIVTKTEASAAGTLTEDVALEVRETKLRLDREFNAMLVKIADRRETLAIVEKQLQALDRLRNTKQSQLKDLERKLVVLLEEQQQEMEVIKRRQNAKDARMVTDVVPRQSPAGHSRGGSQQSPSRPVSRMASDQSDGAVVVTRDASGVTPQQVRACSCVRVCQLIVAFSRYRGMLVIVSCCCLACLRACVLAFNLRVTCDCVSVAAARGSRRPDVVHGNDDEVRLHVHVHDVLLVTEHDQGHEASRHCQRTVCQPPRYRRHAAAGGTCLDRQPSVVFLVNFRWPALYCLPHSRQRVLRAFACHAAAAAVANLVLRRCCPGCKSGVNRSRCSTSPGRCRPASGP